MSAFPLITRTELETITSQPGIVLLDFWQAGCAPCRALEPRLERFAGAHPGAFKGYLPDRRRHRTGSCRRLQRHEHPDHRRPARRARNLPT